jgi:IPT/TIG domain-containing protein
MTSSLRLLALAPLVIFAGCSNALNPFCGSSRPAPLIGSLSPSTVTFTQVQQGVLLKVNGSNFVSASEILINGKALGPTVVSNQQLQIMLTSGVISGPGNVSVKVMTPSGNVGDVGCSSGGTSSALTLTVQ